MKWDNLLGRSFLWGVRDCFSLAQDFYKQNFNITVRNYARPIDWSANNLDLMTLCHEREGFDKITNWKGNDLRPGDMLCLAVGEGNPNHFAVYAGDNMLVHHLFNRFSSEELYRDFWRSMTCFVLRHPDVPDLRPVYPDVSIAELVRARLDFVPPPE